MRKHTVVVALAVLAAGLLVASLAGASGKKNLKADGLTGYQENPDVFTLADGMFRIRIDDSAGEMTYTLDYTGLEGNVTQAHIHFGKRAVNGGISLWLCGTATNPGPAGTPTCPQSGTVTRTVDATAIVGPAGQGIQAGAFAKLAAALRNGSTYANVHSTMWPGGEIRSQINDPR
jgi:hypothetical protein